LLDAKQFGVKVEVKNMNSIRNVQRAIEYEIERQIEAIEKGETLTMETRNFNALTGVTTAMRSKEAANDYRYFPEPDLQPIKVTQDHIDRIKNEMPPLPDFLFKKYTKELSLSDYDAGILTDQKEIALYFEEIIKSTKNYKAAANWLMGDIKSHLNEFALHINELKLKPELVAELISLIDAGKISHNLASQKVFPEMIKTNSSPTKIAEINDWLQTSNEDEVKTIVVETLNENANEVERYKAGETKLLGFLMGQLMKKSKGKADPKSAGKIMTEMLNAK